MDLYTLDRNYEKQDVIDEFSSLIWTERYYGDGDFELVTPVTRNLLEKLPTGILLGIAGSYEIMMLETRDIQGDEMTLKGISLLPWLNNRFVRTSDTHKDRTWYFEPQPPGVILWVMVSHMCTAASPYLSGITPIDIDPAILTRLIIPELGLREYDSEGDDITGGIPFGPLYDAMAEIAKAYKIGMQLLLSSAPDVLPRLGFRSYRGLDRTGRQTVNPIVRFSPELESLNDVKELESISGHKNLVLAFASEVDDSLAASGVAIETGTETFSGFDLRADQVFADIQADQPDTDIIGLLDKQAKVALDSSAILKAVDGEIIPTHMFQFGVHYNMGDIVEIQGNTGVRSRARITEYIRTQTTTGEMAYPTAEIID